MTHFTHDFPHSVDAVIGKLTDSEHLSRRASAAGHRNLEIAVDQQAGKFVIRMQRDVESEIPSFAKKFVNAVNRIHDTIHWVEDGERRTGTYEAKVNDRITVKGNLVIEPTASGCRYTATCDPEVKVPLVGKKIAGVVAKETGKAILGDLQFTNRELDAG